MPNAANKGHSPKKEALDVALIETIVENTIRNQVDAFLFREANLGKKSLLSKSVDTFSKEALLRWRPEGDGFLFSSRWRERFLNESALPVQPQKTQSRVDASEKTLYRDDSPQFVQVGTYQFKPFSFQEPLEKVQSDTTEFTVSLEASSRQNTNRDSQPAFVATEQTLSYHAEQIYRNYLESTTQGGTMVDLSGYKDLTKPPITNGDGEYSTVAQEDYISETEYSNMSVTTATSTATASYSTHPEMNEVDFDYSEYSGNVKTLVQLVNDLPEGVTKQTGAQIIRLTMEAMGISMENVLSDAQSAQSQLLDAVRSNIKKIEEYKTVIRKLETEIRFHQGKANELSEIIDLFILSNTSPNMPHLDKGDVSGY